MKKYVGATMAAATIVARSGRPRAFCSRGKTIYFICRSSSPRDVNRRGNLRPGKKEIIYTNAVYTENPVCIRYLCLDI